MTHKVILLNNKLHITTDTDDNSNGIVLCTSNVEDGVAIQKNGDMKETAILISLALCKMFCQGYIQGNKGTNVENLPEEFQ